MPTSYHIHQSVRGALRDWTGRQWSEATEWITKSDGTKFRSGEELEHWFQQMLDQGIECLPIGECDNFDPKAGCRGHREEEPTSGGQP